MQISSKDTAIHRVAPVPLRHVTENYYPGVFGDFAQSVNRRMESLRAEPTWINKEKARFFEFLLETVDLERYGQLQDRYLNPPIDRGCLKYLDPVSWFEHKFHYAHLLKLHERPPLRILDLGAGPGHFLVIARFYGHSAIGTELPRECAVADHPSHFYSELSAIYSNWLIPHRIEPDTQLAGLPNGVDLVTAFSVAFNLSRGALWEISQWAAFLKSLKEQVLAPRGVLFMSLMNRKMAPDVWNYLVERSSFKSEHERHILLDCL